MFGTWINVAGIVAGGIFGLLWKKSLSATNQQFIKVVLGALTILCGLRLTWVSMNGTFLQVLKQWLIVLVALAFGKLLGRVLHLQKTSNRIGQYAREKMSLAKPENPNRFSDGFNVCALLFCAAPLGILGALTDGISGNPGPLAIKSAMDGLAAMSFVLMFGVGVVLAAIPVLAFQGIITLLCARFLQPLLEHHGLVDSVNSTAGFLICCVALIIFEVKKINVTDYLPALVLAPLLAYWLR